MMEPSGFSEICPACRRSGGSAIWFPSRCLRRHQRPNANGRNIRSHRQTAGSERSVVSALRFSFSRLPWQLLLEYLLNLADFILNLAANFFGRSFSLKIRIVGHLAGFLLDLAFG